MTRPRLEVAEVIRSCRDAFLQKYSAGLTSEQRRALDDCPPTLRLPTAVLLLVGGCRAPAHGDDLGGRRDDERRPSRGLAPPLVGALPRH